MKKLLVLTFFIILSVLMLPGSTALAAHTETSTASADSSPIVSLEGKTIYIVGNSHLYYGNCVLPGNSGNSDTGYLYNIIRSNGEKAKVINHTYPGKTLSYIYSNYLSKIKPEALKKVDYVVFSEAAKQNKNPLGVCKKIMALFPEKTEFFFSSHPILYDRGISEVYNSYDDLRKEGIGIIDWGRLIYDIYTGKTEVPGGIMKYNRLSFIKDNISYDKATDTTKGDSIHPNPLSGYIAAQSIYTALTNRTALYTDYSFCGNKKLNDRFDFDAYIAKNYSTGKTTNFDKIFRSPQDMAGIQKLIDIYNEKESRHAVYKAEGVAATCLSFGLTDGYHCTVCGEVFIKQELIYPNGEHTPVYKKGVAPTCKKDGTTSQAVCSTCSQVLVKSTEIPALGHSYTEKIIDDKHLVTPASYSSAAVYKYDCARCSSTSSKHTFTHGTKLTLKAPAEATATQTLKSVTLAWSKVKKADGYRIKKYDSKTDSWTKVADTQSRILTLDELSSGKKYTFRIYAYIKENNKKVFSKTYNEVATATKPKNIDNIISKQTVNSVTLMWNKVRGATGYNVYINKNGAWEKLGATDALSYKITSLKAGKSYSFSVRPYIKTAEGKVTSPSGCRYETATKPASVTLSAASVSKGSVKLSWSDVKNESGYQVYYSDNPAGPFIKLGDSKANTTFAVFNTLTSAKKYYFKVRAYKTTPNGNVYGAFSEPVKVKIK